MHYSKAIPFFCFDEEGETITSVFNAFSQIYAESFKRLIGENLGSDVIIIKLSLMMIKQFPGKNHVHIMLDKYH